MKTQMPNLQLSDDGEYEQDIVPTLDVKIKSAYVRSLQAYEDERRKQFVEKLSEVLGLNPDDIDVQQENDTLVYVVNESYQLYDYDNSMDHFGLLLRARGWGRWTKLREVFHLADIGKAIDEFERAKLPVRIWYGSPGLVQLFLIMFALLVATLFVIIAISSATGWRW